jgi:mannose-6-phosphate isomerase-like protein (cupin superfamily)
VPLDVRRLDEVPAFTTKDGSEIRELLAFRNSCIRWQSLAEARLPPGASTTPHYHPRTEEIYYILAGSGRMVLEKTVEDVGPGDAIAIPPGSRHQITNIGDELLTFLCCCVPAYEHDDTILVERWPEETDEAEGPLDAAEQPAANDPFDPFVCGVLRGAWGRAARGEPPGWRLAISNCWGLRGAQAPATLNSIDPPPGPGR